MIEQLNVKEPVGGKLSLYYTEAITATAWREVFFITVDHVIDGPLGGQRADGDGDTIQRGKTGCARCSARRRLGTVRPPGKTYGSWSCLAF